MFVWTYINLEIVMCYVFKQYRGLYMTHIYTSKQERQWDIVINTIKSDENMQGSPETQTTMRPPTKQSIPSVIIFSSLLEARSVSLREGKLDPGLSGAEPSKIRGFMKRFLN